MAKVTALKHCRKIDLQKLAEALGVELEEGDTIPIIIQKIEQSNNYDENCALRKPSK